MRICVIVSRFNDYTATSTRVGGERGGRGDSITVMKFEMGLKVHKPLLVVSHCMIVVRCK